MSFVLEVRLQVAEGNEERVGELVPEPARAMESRAGAFYETVVD